MKPTDFAKHLTEFLTVYLPSHRNVSKNTIYSYRDTFKLLIKYCQEKENIPAERITLDTLSKKLLISFLEWVEIERGCCISTRNQRLAAIHSFFRYVQSEEPSGIFHFQKIMVIPMKRANKTLIEHLTPEAIKLILEQPDKNTQKGRRHLTLMSILYDTGARVQELIDIRICDVILENPAIIILTGKGGKKRRIPIMKNSTLLLEAYLSENKLNKPWKNKYPLFTNYQHNKLTKEGVSHIVSKYAEFAKKNSTVIPKKVRVHMFRHSKAMHLLQSGVNPVYIRDFLGHADLKTTEIYAKTDTETKRKAIENVYPDLVDSDLPDWNENQDLLEWLSKLK
jgi:integrase/recombinase XerD